MDRWLQVAHGGQKRALLTILTFLFGLAVSSLALGMPAYPGAETVSQPDGTEIVIRGFGDEHFHWIEDANGFTVVSKGGWFQYAKVGTDGRLESTGLNVGLDDPKANGISKGVLPSAEVRAQSRLVTDNAPQAVPPIGIIKNLVILVRFSDHVSRTQPTEANISVLMNSVTPDPSYAPTGSLRALYLENSYGAMTLDSTIADWHTVSNTEVYFADGVSGSSLLHDALREALIAADAYINFNDFDADNDNFIDSITFLHSGYGAESSGGNDAYGTAQADRIWSHRWSFFSNWTSNEGVRVKDYHISPAVWGISGNDIGRVGVIAHETGHFFGLPDMYDTNGGGEGIGSWGLMANSWDFQFSQLCPPHFSPYSKEFLGWTTPTVITDPGLYTLNQAEFNAEVYQINAGFPSGEYLMIENRQNAGFDCTIPQGGLVIWHVDESASHQTEGYPGQANWPNSGAHYKVAVLQADGNYDLEKGNNRGDGGDTHHGLGVDAIGPGPGGHPNTDTYQGGTVTQTGHVISDISESGSSMTFCLNGCTGLTAPSNLAATAAGIDTINLTWTDNSGLDETGFTISRSLNGTSWANLPNVAANTTAYGDSGLDSGTTYFYRVRAFDATTTSGWSATASATTDDVPPATPTGLVLTVDGENVIDLVWGDASNNEDGFRVERSTSATSGFTTVTTVGADTISFSNTGLNASTTYYYRVYAFNTFDSPGFAAANARTDDPPPIVRYNAYADQFGSGLVSGTYVDTHADDEGLPGGAVQWIEEKVSGGKKKDRTTYMGHFWRFNIAAGDVIRVYANAYQSASGDNDTFDFTWSDNDSNYGDPGHDLFNVSELNSDNTEFGTIPNSVSGQVWIRVIDSDRTLGNSSSREKIFVDELYIEVENFGPPSVPADPTSLVVDWSDFTYIDFHWTDNANNETEYRVERSEDGGNNWTEIDVLPANAESYSDTGLPNGVTRHYRVYAWNGTGPSGYSNSDSGTTLIPPPAPTAPFNLTATRNADGYSDVTLNWEHSGADTSEDGFRVQRSTDGGATYPNTFVAGGPNTLFYVDSSIEPNTDYRYRVHAYNDTASGWSNFFDISTLDGPTNLVLESVSGFKDKGKKNYVLTWSPSGGAADIDVYINSVNRGSVPDTGSETLGTNLKGGGVDNVMICQSGGGLCSDTLNVIW